MPELLEGPEAWGRFKNIMRGLMAVPRAEILKREQEHRAEVAKNPNRRGPKTKKQSRSDAE
jgi:hypothetical protein